MAADVAAFVRKHGLERPTLIGHSMGAKTAMALALREPDLIESIIAVDNAPVDVRLESDFARYIQGMKKIDNAGVTKQAEADKILEPYEKVFLLFLSFLPLLSDRHVNISRRHSLRLFYFCTPQHHRISNRQPVLP